MSYPIIRFSRLARACRILPSAALLAAVSAFPGLLAPSPLHASAPPLGDFAERYYNSERLNLSYPSNWQIDQSAYRIRVRNGLIIDSPGESYVRIELLPASQAGDPAQLLENVVLALDGKAIKTRKRLNFERWGQWQGQGLELRGKIMAVTKGSIRIFICDAGPNTFIVTEYHFRDDGDRSAEFAAIADSFRLR